MEFLKEILGEELYSQFAEKVNAYNGNEANKEKQIKLANLTSGEYVGKGKFDAEVENGKSKQAELDTANGLIAELKKATKGNEEIQGKVSVYETQVAELQAQLKETKVKYAVDVAMLSAGVKKENAELLSIALERKLKEKGSTLELDENENIKGWDDMISGLKTQFPTMFETASNKKIVENKLEQGKDNDLITKSDLLKKPYAERVKLAEENPEAYKAAMNA